MTTTRLHPRKRCTLGIDSMMRLNLLIVQENVGKKMATLKRKNEWIASSFGDFAASSPSSVRTKMPIKRKNEDRIHEQTKILSSMAKSDSQKDPSCVPWAERYHPTAENDLAVHKKKIAEVKDWLLRKLTSTYNKNHSNILVLTGPAGAGKSATVDVLRRDLDVEVQEWNTPTTNANEEYSAWKDFRMLSTDSQRKQFQDFLLRANKYPTLSISGQQASTNHLTRKKIILVEDIPNVFYRSTKDFYDILRQFQATSRNPMIFVISDSYIGESSFYSLFPKRIQIELKISCISFNPIANTNLMKSVNKILKAESQVDAKNFQMPTRDMLDVLVASSNGDIRACINSLQFYCRNDGRKNAKHNPKKANAVSSKLISKAKPAAKGKLKPEFPDDGRKALFGRDTSLLLFKALGKLLYSKRKQAEDVGIEGNLPDHLKHCRRNKLLIDPEKIVEMTHVQSSTFSLYLHQNYLGFYSDIGEASNASQFFSDADIISGHWSTRDVLESYSSSIVTRGVVFSNGRRSNSPTGAVSGGWRPLHRPQWFDSFKKENSNRKTARDLFQDLRHPAADLHTEVLPFIAKTNVSLRTPSHIAFVQMISRFKLRADSSCVTLDHVGSDASAMPDEIVEEDAPEMASKDDVEECGKLSQVTLETQQSSEEVESHEEHLIEDFSDDDYFDDLLLLG